MVPVVAILAVVLVILAVVLVIVAVLLVMEPRCHRPGRCTLTPRPQPRPRQ